MKRIPTIASEWLIAAIVALAVSAFAGHESFPASNQDAPHHARDFHQKGFLKT